MLSKTNFIFLLLETNFGFVVCSYVIWEFTKVYQEKILYLIIKTKVLKSQPRKLINQLFNSNMFQMVVSRLVRCPVYVSVKVTF